MLSMLKIQEEKKSYFKRIICIECLGNLIKIITKGGKVKAAYSCKSCGSVVEVNRL